MAARGCGLPRRLRPAQLASPAALFLPGLSFPETTHRMPPGPANPRPRADLHLALSRTGQRASRQGSVFALAMCSEERQGAADALGTLRAGGSKMRSPDPRGPARVARSPPGPGTRRLGNPSSETPDLHGSRGPRPGLPLVLNGRWGMGWGLRIPKRGLLGAYEPGYEDSRLHGGLIHSA